MNTHCAFSLCADVQVLPALLEYLAVEWNADMLLSGAVASNAQLPDEVDSALGDSSSSAEQSSDDRYGQDSRCVIGIDVQRELLLTPQVSREALHEFCFASKATTLGYISYTYGLHLYGIASSKHNDMPLGHLKQYAMVLHVCTRTGKITCTASTLHPPSDKRLRELQEVLAEKIAEGIPALRTSHGKESLQAGRRHTGALVQSLSREAYMRGVEDVLEHIRSGDTYQLNLSIKFSVPLFDPAQCDAQQMHNGAVSMLSDMWQSHPAPFYAWFVSGSRRVLSTSPERFLRVRDGVVLSQPIKGTLAFDTYEEGLERKVTESAKESAELSMIVDLIRNDISTHCEYGSVEVAQHKSTFIVDNLIQMYSNVSGRLKEDSTCLDLLLDAFPGGSITGCPKLRTMEIIERLEPHSRDVYCGSIVCIEDEKTMDSNIGIRTGWVDTDTGSFSFLAGSGLVIDSDPASEYEETLSKAGKFLRVVTA